MRKSLTARVDSKGRLTLPEPLRKKYGWGPGTTFFIEEENGVLRLASAVNPFEAPSGEESDQEAARARLGALIEQIRSQVPDDLSDEELDTLVEAEIAAVRRERRARRS